MNKYKDWFSHNIKSLKQFVSNHKKKSILFISIFLLISCAGYYFLFYEQTPSLDQEETELKEEIEDLDIEESNEETEEEIEEEVEEDIETEEDEKLSVFVPSYKSISNQTNNTTTGIDVSYYQGIIDWDLVDVDFAMIKIGSRGISSGTIQEDSCAQYNLQEATANGIYCGAYFFSTAITVAEAIEEANFVCDIIDSYSISYPVVYNCENFDSTSSRQYGLTVEERSEIAVAFLEQVESRGYVGMFYASSSHYFVEDLWDKDMISSSYRLWIAKYGTFSDASDYCNMWQYSDSGTITGISTSVDLNYAYFGVSKAATPKSSSSTVVDIPSDESLGSFTTTNDSVTAKDVVNVRSSMDQSDSSNIIGELNNGTVVTRLGYFTSGWSKISFNGEVGYVVSSLITTETSYVTPQEEEEVETFTTVFSDVNETVTAKDVINLRDIPSVEDSSTVITQLTSDDTATRTGVSSEGWSRVVYQGETYYCISSYLEVVE